MRRKSNHGLPHGVNRLDIHMVMNIFKYWVGQKVRSVNEYVVQESSW